MLKNITGGVIGGLIAGAAILLLSGLFTGGFSGGAESRATNVDATFKSVTGLNGFTVSSTSDAVGKVKFGNCIIHDVSTTIAATTTATVSCQGGASSLTAISGIVAGDTIFVQATTSMPTTFEGLQIQGANASSTNGYIHMKIYNGTGTTFTWTNTASTSVKYYVIRGQ